MLLNSFNMPTDYKSNGCGDSKTSRIVPDTIYGLSIFEACRLHDWAYVMGKTVEDKNLADFEFLQNLLTIINEHKSWYYPHWLARRRAMTYYDAVTRFGHDAFYEKSL